LQRGEKHTRITITVAPIVVGVKLPDLIDSRWIAAVEALQRELKLVSWASPIHRLGKSIRDPSLLIWDAFEPGGGRELVVGKPQLAYSDVVVDEVDDEDAVTVIPAVENEAGIT